MAAATLSPLSSPIGIFPSSIATSQTTLVATLKNKQLDGGLWEAYVVAPGQRSTPDSGTKLFTLCRASHWIRSPTPFIKNSQDVIICRLKHNTTRSRLTFGKGCKWKVQVPDGRGYKSIGFSDSTKSKTWSTGIDLTIKNLAVDGRPVTVHVHQPVNTLDQYHATINEVVVARASRFKAEPWSKFSNWQVEIAQGFDLILGFVICRILAWHPLTRTWVKDEIGRSADFKLAFGSRAAIIAADGRFS